MKINKHTAGVLTQVLLCGGFLTIPSARAAAKSNSAEINRLLSEAHDSAIQFDADSEKMSAFTRSNVSWESYATQVNSIKEHVNAAGKTLAVMKSEHDSGSAWQQTAIDRITPLLREMAANTELVINTLNRNQSRVHMKEFQDYVEANTEIATELSSVIGNFVSYGNTKAKLDKLAAKLEIE